MKVTINSIIASENNAQFVLNYTAKKDDGTLIVTENISIMHVDSDIDTAKAYVKQAIKSRITQLISEKDSVTKPEIQKIIGQEFNV